MSVEMLNL